MRAAPNVTGPRDLPDWRLWLVDQWAPGAPYQKTYAAGHLSLAAVTGDPGDVGRDMARWEYRNAQQAALWWVSDEMTDLVNAAAPSVPDSYALHLDEAPDIAGCVVFAHPLYGIDANIPDRQVQVDAILWAPVALPAAPMYGRPGPCSAIGMSMYQRISLGDVDGPSLRLLIERGALADVRATDGDVNLTWPNDAVTNHGGTWHPQGLDDSGREFGMIEIPDSEASGVIFGTETRASIPGYEDHVVWLPLGRSDWIIGESITTPIVDGLADMVNASMIEDRRWLAALWLLAGQVNVATRSTENPDRPARRRSERAKVDPTVTVVRLRRLREPSEHGDGPPGPGREWKHRWIVGGHWRNQPYGPGRSLRRPVWIAPYVKGPEGMPLVARPKVKALVR